MLTPLLELQSAVKRDTVGVGSAYFTVHRGQPDTLESLCRNRSVDGARQLGRGRALTALTVIVLLGCRLTWLACFCPEGQRGAEGGNGLADSPADVLGDHRQHVLL